MGTILAVAQGLGIYFTSAPDLLCHFTARFEPIP